MALLAEKNSSGKIPSTQCGCTRITPRAPLDNKSKRRRFGVHRRTYSQSRGQKKKLLGSGAARRLWRRRLWHEVSLHHRTLVVQAAEIGSRRGGVSILHANASLIKAAVTLGGCSFIMPREFRSPASHAEATSYASFVLTEAKLVILVPFPSCFCS